jgi:anti-sigma B factor antagonist
MTRPVGQPLAMSLDYCRTGGNGPTEGASAAMISVSTERDGGALTLAVSGDIDLASSPVVSDAIGAALAADGVATVQVNLSGVRFMDSSGIALLLKARRDADERSITLRVVGARGSALQVLELTGVLAHLSGRTGPDQPAAP